MRKNTGLKTLIVFAAAAGMMFAGGPALAWSGPTSPASASHATHTPPRAHPPTSSHKSPHKNPHHATHRSPHRPPAPRAYTCRSGTIGSGTYASITVAGPCAVAEGATVTVRGDITLRSGAVFDAQSALATLTVDRNIVAVGGTMLGLGCQSAADVGNSAHPCTTDATGHTTITVKGGITALKAATVLINGVHVRGSITVLGGGAAIPWSIKNNTVGGSITVTGANVTWLGVMFNTVSRSVTLSHVTVTDADPGAPGVYVVQNTIRHDLVCTALKPGVSGGFSPTEVNTVGHRAYGQCAALV